MRDIEQSVRLRVAEGVQTDVGKGIVRLPRSVMRRLGLGRDQTIVEIVGGATTAAVAVPLYEAGGDESRVAMDGLVRQNARVGLGEWIEVRAADAVRADRIVLAPARPGMVLRGGGSLLLNNLLDRPLSSGDIISTAIFHKPREVYSEEDYSRTFFQEFFESPAFGLGEVRLMVVGTEPRGIVTVHRDTAIEVVAEMPDDVRVKDATTTYEDVGGLSNVIHKLREVVELPLKHPELFERLAIDPPRGILLYGPPGTGKTLLARAVANESDAYFTTISGPEIVGKYYGESEQRLREVFNDAAEHAPAIIFIDELDAIAPRRDSVSGETERRIVAQLLTLLDGMRSDKRVVVIGATNRVESIDRALRRPGRFDREIELRVPDERGRLDIMRIHTRGMPLEVDVDMVDIARRTVGFTGSDLAALVREAGLHAVNRWFPSVEFDGDRIPAEALARLHVKASDFEAMRRGIVPSGMREVAIRVPDVRWDDIGGLESVKRVLHEVVELPLTRPDIFSRLGVRPSRGVMLYGPPGTGKTMLAKAVANEANANFISVKSSEVLSKWYGDSERRIEELFRRARQVAPAILFFDEIDSLVPARGQGVGEPQVTGRIVNQFLAELDGLEELKGVVVIGATNRPDIVDAALMRPGRFDEVVYVPVPDRASRLSILTSHVAGMALADDVDLEWIADHTDRFTGADLSALVKRAAMLAVRDDSETETIGGSYFAIALDGIRPSVTEDVERFYERAKQNMTRGKRALGFQPTEQITAAASAV